MSVPPLCYAATAAALIAVCVLFVIAVRRAAGHMTVDDGRAFGGDE
jgi:hypothetical protein